MFPEPQRPSVSPDIRARLLNLKNPNKSQLSKFFIAFGVFNISLLIGIEQTETLYLILKGSWMVKKINL